MYKKILVPLDGSEMASQALDHAMEIAGPGSEITLLRVVSPLELDEQAPGLDVDQLESDHVNEAQAYLDGLLARFRTPARAVVKRGSAASAIVDMIESEGFDIVVMSSHGRSGISRWVHGSVAGRVLQNSVCPVLLVQQRRLAPTDFVKSVA